MRVRVESLYFVPLDPDFRFGEQLFQLAAAKFLAELAGIRHIAQGKLERVLDWLRRNVHAHGRRFPTRELCRKTTGDVLGHASAATTQRYAHLFEKERRESVEILSFPVVKKSG